jgi:hypothetical protein
MTRTLMRTVILYCHGGCTCGTGSRGLAVASLCKVRAGVRIFVQMHFWFEVNNILSSDVRW